MSTDISTVLVSSVLIIILIIRDELTHWASPSGLMLMGSLSAEKIQENGTSTFGFSLKYAAK